MMADRMHLRSEIHRLVIWSESGSASRSSLFFLLNPSGSFSDLKKSGGESTSSSISKFEFHS